jgi:hypothetical protein
MFRYMSFRFVRMGSIVAEDPKAAADELSRRMAACGNNMGVVAKEYGVHRDTFARWLDQLAEAGCPVTGRGEARRGRRTTEERIDEKIDRSGGPEACWPWMGPCHDFGYGLLTDGSRTDGTRRSIRVPRFVLERKLGRKIAEGMQANHTCDRPECCNPEHLYEGTQAENMRDRFARGRGRVRRAPAPSAP